MSIVSDIPGLPHQTTSSLRTCALPPCKGGNPPPGFAAVSLSHLSKGPPQRCSINAGVPET